MRANKAILISAVVLAIPVGLIGLLAAFNRRDEIRSIGQEFVYDDFGFSVMGLRYENRLGSGDTPQGWDGNTAVVTLRVRNHALRVPYSFKTQSAILSDSAGNGCRFFPWAQMTLDLASPDNAHREDPIQPGCERTFNLAFEVPRPLTASTFRISEGGSLGDILDYFIFGRKLAVLDSTGGAKP